MDAAVTPERRALLQCSGLVVIATASAMAILWLVLVCWP